MAVEEAADLDRRIQKGIDISSNPFVVHVKVEGRGVLAREQSAK